MKSNILTIMDFGESGTACRTILQIVRGCRTGLQNLSAGHERFAKSFYSGFSPIYLSANGFRDDVEAWLHSQGMLTADMETWGQ